MRDKKNFPYGKLVKLETKIRYKFKDPSVLRNALTHESFFYEHREEGFSHYERLEFLGDSVLGLVIAHTLFERYPERSEGWLAKTKALVVSKDILYEKALKINLGTFLFLGKGELKSGGNKRESILTDSFEALIGALFLDGGYKVAKKFILHLFEEDIERVIQEELMDFKTVLQEITQEKFRSLPVYEILGENGTEHDKKFRIVVKIKRKIIGEGEGKTKKEAGQMAAKKAIEMLKEQM